MKINWVKSLLINALIMGVILVLTDLSYESNDDFGISLRILEGYDNVLLVNMFLCRVLIPLQAALTGINVFVWMQMFMSFVAFTVFLKLILDQGKSAWFTLVCVLAITVFAFDHYAVIQFTKTSALLVVVGALVLTDAVIEMRNPLYHLLGMVLLYTGACLRFVNLYVAIAFGALYLLVWAIRYRKNLKTDGYLDGKRIALYIVLVIMLCGTYAMNYYSHQNPGVSDYNSYNRVRADIIDYPVYQNYSLIKDDLKEMGISKNDLYLIDAWYLDYDGAASQENLAKIDQIYRQSGSVVRTPREAVGDFVHAVISDVRKLNPAGIHILLLLLLAGGGILCLRPKYWPYILLLGGFTILLYLYLYYLGRTVYRATYIADLGAALWLLYYYYDDMQWRNKRGAVSGFAIWERRVLCVLGSLLLMAALYPQATYCNDKAADLSAGVMDREMTEYIDSHEDDFFVFSTREKDYQDIYLHPAAAPPEGFEKNVLCFGGWGTRSQFTLDHLKAYGLNNMFGDIIDNGNVYVVEQKNADRLEKYFNKWYGSDERHITLEQTDEVAGQKIWQVVSHQGRAEQKIAVPQKRYGVAVGAEPFNLNVKAKTDLTYTSSDPDVAEVFDDGMIRPGKEGRATIRITARKTENFRGASRDVTVTVSSYHKTNGKLAQSSEDYDEQPGDSSGRESKIGKYDYDPDKNWKSWQYIVRCTDPRIADRAARAVRLIVKNENFGYNGHYPENQEEVDQRKSIYNAIHEELGDNPSMKELDQIRSITTKADTSCTPTLLAAYWLYYDMDQRLSLKWHKPYDKKKFTYYCGTVNVEYHQLETAIKTINEEYAKAGRLEPFQLIQIPEKDRAEFFSKKNIKKNLKRGDIICSCPDYNDNGHTAMAM